MRFLEDSLADDLFQSQPVAAGKKPEGAGHSLGIIHRDVKPYNILLEGSLGRTVLTDFGIAKALTSTTGPGTLTATGVAIGTPHYMSPEQAAGDREIDGRSDIYSLGVVGYQMLAGELPFSAPTVPGLLLKQITEQAPNLKDRTPTCPDDLASCVMRALEKEPEARWPTADALRRALESRSAPPYRPARRASAGGARGETRLGPPRLSPVGGAERRRTTRPTTRKDPRKDLTPSGEPKLVAKFRDSFVSWASVCGGLMFIDLMMGGGLSWSLFPTGLWGGFGLLPQYMKLWHTGYSWRDVLNRPAAPDAFEASLASRRSLGPAQADEFGRHADTVQMARNDREAILKIMERVPPSERKLLPDVVQTIDALLKRAEDLARMLHGMSADVDEGALGRIESRIEAVRQHEEGSERDRQIDLLERQRQTLLRRAAEFVDDIEDLQTPTATHGQGETELATRQVDVELRKTLDASTRTTLEDVTRALARLDDGSYGICTGCHRPIERARLLALPQVALCVSCQTRREKGA